MGAGYPTEADRLDRSTMERLLQTVDPTVRIDGVEVTDAWTFDDRGGGEVSTAGRIAVTVSYADRREWPAQLMVKVSRPALPAHPLYRNEVAVYRNLRPELAPPVRAPRCFGADFDERTATFALALEDLRTVGADFWNVTKPTTVAQIEALLDVLAALHARYWASPRFGTDLAWVQPHVSGELHELFSHPELVPAMIRDEVARNQFKRELLQQIRQSPASLDAQVRRLQQQQATLVPTLCHGDAHIGNCYFVGRTAGLVDWQLTARGHHLHDVHYLLVTGLSVDDRRAHERDLLARYLEQLAAAGVEEPPTFAATWLEYRRAVAWGLYVGWLTTPVANYGWEITVANHIRLVTAYQDLETAAALAMLDTP
jgi:hypothetical protein